MDKPNIILINCDDLGYGDLGCYGSENHKTPYLDNMAEEGLRFTDFYMASPVCSPSRGAMMTGCYPRRIGFGTFDGKWVLFPGDPTGLGPDEKTIADCLKEQDYATMLVGKWHCGDQPEFLPTRHGFDHYFGLPYSNDMGRQPGRRADYPPLPLLQDEEVIQVQPDQAALIERYVEKAVRFIRDNKDQPFFLYFAQMYVHLPHYAPPRFLRENDNPYAACVACIDWSVGVILDELKRQGIDENTLVVFTSDNGSRCDFGKSNGPLRGIKGTTWEGGQRLPCIMRWPGRIQGGRTSGALVSSIDFLPTFCTLTGSPVLQQQMIDGLDFSSLILDKGEKESPRKNFFYYFKDDLEAVRQGKWKLHVRKNGEEILELYNLETDIGETLNLAGQNPQVAADLQQVLQHCREDLGDASRGMPGANCRPVGRVTEPRPLTSFDPGHPYMLAEYDLSDAG